MSEPPSKRPKLGEQCLTGYTPSKEPAVAPEILIHTYTDEKGQFVRRLFPFNPKNIVYQPLKRMSFGGHCVKMSYKLVSPEHNLDKEVPIVLQAPPMRTSFGMSTTSQQSEKLSLDLSFYKQDEDEDVHQFFLTMKAWDDRNLDEAKKNKDDWFANSGDIEPEVLRHFYKASTRTRKRNSDGKEFSPSLSLKCPKINTQTEPEFAATFFSEDKTRIMDPEGTVTKQSRVLTIFSSTGMWFQASSFSPGFELQQCQILPNDCIVMGRDYAFV